MREVAIKTHLIIQSVHDEYHMSWQGKIINTKPSLKMINLCLLLLAAKGAWKLILLICRK